MIRGGFLSEEDRNKLIALAREGSVASRVTRRVNALVLLDDGWSCQEVADAFLLNDDTIRGWFKLFEQRGIEGLTSFDVGGSASFLSAEQEDALKAFVGATLPRSTRQVGAFIEQEFGLVYESRSGLIALLHRLGLEYHKPDIIPRKLNKEKQQAFIESYDNLSPFQIRSATGQHRRHGGVSGGGKGRGQGLSRWRRCERSEHP